MRRYHYENTGERGGFVPHPPEVLSGALVFFGVLNLPGKNLPAPEIDAVCQGQGEFVSFSWGRGGGGALLSHLPAEA